MHFLWHFVIQCLYTGYARKLQVVKPVTINKLYDLAANKNDTINLIDHAVQVYNNSLFGEIASTLHLIRQYSRINEGCPIASRILAENFRTLIHLSSLNPIPIKQATEDHTQHTLSHELYNKRHRSGMLLISRYPMMSAHRRNSYGSRYNNNTKVAEQLLYGSHGTIQSLKGALFVILSNRVHKLLPKEVSVLSMIITYLKNTNPLDKLMTLILLYETNPKTELIDKLPILVGIANTLDELAMKYPNSQFKYEVLKFSKSIIEKVNAELNNQLSENKNESIASALSLIKYLKNEATHLFEVVESNVFSNAATCSEVWLTYAFIIRETVFQSIIPLMQKELPLTKDISSTTENVTKLLALVGKSRMEETYARQNLNKKHLAVYKSLLYSLHLSEPNSSIRMLAYLKKRVAENELPPEVLDRTLDLANHSLSNNHDFPMFYEKLRTNFTGALSELFLKTDKRIYKSYDELLNSHEHGIIVTKFVQLIVKTLDVLNASIIVINKYFKH